MDRAAFLAERRTGIGGSDAAVVCGMSPWKTALELYHEKRGEIPDDKEESERMYWGTTLEAVIADHFARENDALLEERDIMRHQDYPFLIVHMDRAILTFRGEDCTHFPGYLEIKTADAFLKKEWMDGPPAHYQLQLQHGLMVSGWTWGAVAVLIGGNTYKQWTFERDDTLISSLIQLEMDFWRRVQAGNPPDPDFGHRTALDMFKRLHRAVNEEVVDLPPRAQDLHEAMAQASEGIKEHTKDKDKAKAELLHLMGEAGTGILPDGSSYVRQKRKRGKTEYIQLTHKKKKGK